MSFPSKLEGIDGNLIEDVALVDVDGDERFELDALRHVQVVRGLIDQRVQDLQKVRVGLGHRLKIRHHPVQASPLAPDQIKSFGQSNSAPCDRGGPAKEPLRRRGSTSFAGR